MKDYRLKDSKIKDYITDVEIIRKVRRKSPTDFDEISIRFADGRVFDKIIYDEENMKKIIEQQELQAQEGLQNIGAFKKRKTKAGRICLATTIGTSIGLGLGMAANGEFDEPIALAASAGIVTIMALPSLCSYLKNSIVLKELDKIRYRNQHLEELTSFTDYEHSLAGLSSKTVKYMNGLAEQGKNPFSIYRIDSYTKEDLEQIVDNINTEKAYQFTYVKK